MEEKLGLDGNAEMRYCGMVRLYILGRLVNKLRRGDELSRRRVLEQLIAFLREVEGTWPARENVHRLLSGHLHWLLSEVPEDAAAGA